MDPVSVEDSPYTRGRWTRPWWEAERIEKSINHDGSWKEEDRKYGQIINWCLEKKRIENLGVERVGRSPP